MIRHMCGSIATFAPFTCNGFLSHLSFGDVENAFCALSLSSTASALRFAPLDPFNGQRAALCSLSCKSQRSALCFPFLKASALRSAPLPWPALCALRPFKGYIALRFHPVPFKAIALRSALLPWPAPCALLLLPRPALCALLCAAWQSLNR
jgi:hypothetical protein